MTVITIVPSVVLSAAYSEEATPHLTAEVTADAINVYAEPTEESRILGKLWHGVRVAVYEIRSGWLLVETSNRGKGWIQNDNIKTLKEEKDITSLKEEAGARPELQAVGRPYRIKRGDTIDIRSFKNPEINDELTVRPDGYISLLLLDDVYVSGLSPSELDRLLTEKYREHFLDPELTVILNQIIEVMESRVYVGGEVGNPQEIPLLVPTTVLQAIIATGGFLHTAKSQNVVLVRKGDQNEPIIYSLNLSKIKGGKPVPDNIYLQPFDIVYVPATKVAKVGIFVEQHINMIVPDFFSTGFNWFRQIP